MKKFINEKYWVIKDEQPMMKNIDLVDTAYSYDEEQELLNVEDGSWWYIYRAKVIHGLCKQYFDKSKEVIDIGGGNGYTTYELQKQDWDVTLLEPSPFACKNAKRRGLKEVYCGTIDKKCINDSSIEQAMLLDVLEHVEDDLDFLNTIYDKIEEGGTFLLTVPAYQHLWCSEDDIARHYRRYSLTQLENLILKTNFNIVYKNYFMSFLYFPLLVIRVWLEKLKLRKRAEQQSKKEREEMMNNQFLTPKGIIGGVLKLLETIEKRRLLKNKKVRFGTSIIVILEKPKKGQAL